MRIRSVARVVLYGALALAIVGVGCKKPLAVTPAAPPAPDLTTLESLGPSTTPEMLGDQSPARGPAAPPRPTPGAPSTGAGAAAGLACA